MINLRRFLARSPLARRLESITRERLIRLPGVLGRKAREFFGRVDDARGYIWAPYTVVHRQPTFLDLDDFNLSDEDKARYCKVKLRKDYYGKVKF